MCTPVLNVFKSTSVFMILTKYEAKIQEALVMKKQNPKLNRKLDASGSSFLPSVY